MPDKIKYLKRNICEEKEYHLDILFLLLKIYVKNTFEMLICAKRNRIIVENDELNKVLRKNIDK